MCVRKRNDNKYCWVTIETGIMRIDLNKTEAAIEKEKNYPEMMLGTCILGEMALEEFVYVAGEREQCNRIRIYAVTGYVWHTNANKIHIKSAFTHRIEFTHRREHLDTRPRFRSHMRHMLVWVAFYRRCDMLYEFSMFFLSFFRKSPVNYLMMLHP